MRFGGTVVYVDDVPATVDFYQRAFGLKVRFADEDLGYIDFETGGSSLAIAAHSLGEMLMPGAYRRRTPSGVEIAFLTENVSDAYAKIVAAGAQGVAPPKRMPWGLEVAYLRAPEGTLIGLSEPPPTLG